MKLRLALWGIALAGASTTASAGPYGEVASSFDEDDQFDFHLILDYDYALRRSVILRERVGEGGSEPGDPIPLSNDLVFSGSRHTITPRAELGIYKDVALTFGLPIVVLDDGWLSLIQVKQARRRLGIYGTQTRRGEAPAPPAHYFGVPAVGVRTPEALAKALREALDADHPTVIEAAVDPGHYLETVYD